MTRFQGGQHVDLIALAESAGRARGPGPLRWASQPCVAGPEHACDLDVKGTLMAASPSETPRGSRGNLKLSLENRSSIKIESALLE